MIQEGFIPQPWEINQRVPNSACYTLPGSSRSFTATLWITGKVTGKQGRLLLYPGSAQTLPTSKDLCHIHTAVTFDSLSLPFLPLECVFECSIIYLDSPRGKSARGKQASKNFIYLSCNVKPTHLEGVDQTGFLQIPSHKELLHKKLTTACQVLKLT